MGRQEKIFPCALQHFDKWLNQAKKGQQRSVSLAGTIPDGLQVTGSDASLSMEAARMPAARETDAAEKSEWSDFFDSMEDVKVASRNATFR